MIGSSQMCIILGIIMAGRCMIFSLQIKLKMAHGALARLKTDMTAIYLDLKDIQCAVEIANTMNWKKCIPCWVNK